MTRNVSQILALLLSLSGFLFSHTAEAAGPDIEFIQIKGGQFAMGSDEPSCGGCPGPARLVQVADFQISKTEVTVAQWKACVEAGVCGQVYDGKRCNITMVTRLNHPINCLTKSQATAFAGWVGGRLPTEAEWEYAARGQGQDIPFPWGDAAPSCERANVDGCGKGRTWPVCSFPEGNTAQGLCDMGGNVAEWVADHHNQFSKVPADGTAQKTGSENSGWWVSVVRGGGWSRTQSLAPASYLDPQPSTRMRSRMMNRRFDHISLGFRVAK